MPYRRIKYLPTIRRIPDDLWNEIEEVCFSLEKPNDTIGRPIIPFRKVLKWNSQLSRTTFLSKLHNRSSDEDDKRCHIYTG